jgi:hypothetical protein
MRSLRRQFATPHRAGRRAALLACAASLAIASLSIASLAQPAAPSEVDLRGPARDAAIQQAIGPVLALSLAGVEVRDLSAPEGVERSRVISWDRVRAIRGGLADDAAPFADIATDAWRARTRMERRDYAGAEPLLEQLFVRFRGQQGPTAAMVASGLLRCRLHRQAQSAAVEAWLALMASEQTEVRFEGSRRDEDIAIASVLDEQWGLAPQLPPLWVRGPALRVVLGAIAGEGEATNRAGRLALLYRLSAAVDAGEVTDSEAIAKSLGARPTGDQGLELVWDVVASRVGAGEQRDAAVAGLRARLAPRDPDAEPLAGWVEAWTRVALGRAMLVRFGEPADDAEKLAQADARNLGIVQLLHVPARLEGVSPYLAGLALAEVGAALEQDGQTEAASRVRRMFFERFAGHPAQSMLMSARASLDTGGGAK